MKPKINAILLFAIAFVSFTTFKAEANTRIYPDLFVTVTSNSDWAITVSWDYSVEKKVVNSTCLFGITQHQVEIFRNNFDEANRVDNNYSAEAILTGNVKIGVGPNHSNSYGLRYTVYADLCTQHSWSGFWKNDAGVWVPYSATEAELAGLAGRYTNYVPVQTAPIKAPVNLKATNEAYFDKVVLTWAKGTDIPDDLHYYRIYRSTTNSPTAATIVHTTAKNGTLTWTDNNINPNDVYFYWVSTCYTNYENHQELPRTTTNSVVGSAKKALVNASDGEFVNRVRITWPDLSSYADEVKIERSVPGSSTEKEELAMLSKNAQTYNDADAIPGYNYTYYVTAIRIGTTFTPLTDTGYRQPNGVISGTVKSPLGTGVAGVQVCATPKTTIIAGAPSVTKSEYCTVTDNEGYFEIRDIYYFDKAEFEIVPSKSGSKTHVFSPGKISRTLDLNTKTIAGLSFTDESVFTVGGRVTYHEPDLVNKCGVPEVEIILNGESRMIKTDEDGKWEYTLQDEGLYTFAPKFLHHTFDKESVEIIIEGDKTDIDFIDTQTDKIVIKVRNGCDEAVSTNATVLIKSSDNCFNQEFTVDASGLLTTPNLPARKYTVKVTAIEPANENILNQIGNKTVEVDLTQRDSSEVLVTRDNINIVPADTTRMPNGSIHIIPADTVKTQVTDTLLTEVVPKAYFIYHSPLKVEVGFEEAGVLELANCNNSANTPIRIMEQGETYKLIFTVTEEKGGCPVKEGVLRIFDFVSDQGDAPVDIPINEGTAYYIVQPGLPDLSSNAEHEHEKLLYVMPQVGFLPPEPIDYWILVTGFVGQAPTFFTESPELPMLVLHDPPGDQSYAFIEKGTTIEHFNTLEVAGGGEAGFFSNVKVGGAVNTPYFDNKIGALINFSTVAGRDNNKSSGLKTTMTTTERFSTSAMESLIGNDGDVFVGASFNQEFSRGDELTFNTETCSATIKPVIAMDVPSYATTFIYTEYHVKNTIIPQLDSLAAALLSKGPSLTEVEKLQYNRLVSQKLAWNSFLQKINENRTSPKAVLEKNISFSAGASYTSQSTSDSIWSDSFEYTAFVNGELALGVAVEAEGGIWLDVEAGYMAKWRWSQKKASGTDSTLTRTVGYVLDDNDPGDFFSVDIKKDKVYSVPAFELKGGTTSCPAEPNTQPRDEAKITIINPEINNVPLGVPATLVAKLTNNSQSRETRDYMVQVISNTNPDGAIIKLGGTLINNSPAMYTIDFRQDIHVALTVERGPIASNYGPIALIMAAPCCFESGNFTGADTAYIWVNFQTICSNIALYKPGNGWLVNKQKADQLHIVFTGYDQHNQSLESIGLQFRSEGQGWIDQVTIPKDNLVGNFYDYIFDVTNLKDGNYILRAVANCNNNGMLTTTYSSEQSGKIDRTSMAPFGTPSPSDGFLRHGQEISVTFDKDIDCGSLNLATIKLLKPDSTEIPVTAQCYGNMLIIKPVADLFMQPELEGVLLNALVSGVRDQSGNIQEYPTRWSFLVNVSPVSWNPGVINAAAEESEKLVMEGILNNSATISKAFTISEWPWWVTPSVTSASVLRDNTFSVYFNATEGLKPGHYEGEIIALVDNIEEVLVITLDLYATDINWNVNSSDFEYSMGITAQFSTDQNDLNLSDCTRDKIAAFVNGQLRGIGEVTYVPEFDKYAAFINVYGIEPGNNGSLLESEAYVADLSVQDITITDNGASSGASSFKKNNWIEFDIYATKTGTFKTELRLAATTAGKTLQLLVDGALQASLTVPVTGSLATYTTLVSQLNLSKGLHKFRIYSVDAEFDLNWINFPEYHVRNASSSEIIKFRMWDGLNGIEYAAVEELTFFSDGQVGSAINPFLLHPSGGIQDMHLSKGWTWISVNKETDNMGLDRVFESITDPTSTNDITLKSQTAFAQYSSGTGWQGALTAIDPQLGYMVYLNNHPDTLIMVGENPDKKPFVLKTKWNWIGFPSPEIGGVNDVLESLQSHTGDLLRGQYAFAEYYPVPGLWIGNLTTFEPGRGYKLFATNGGTLEMLKSASADNLSLNHEFNMTLTAAIHLGQISPSDDLVLHTFIDNQLRGECPMKYNPVLSDNMAFAMIYGDRQDIGKPVELALYNYSLQQYITLTGPKITFEIDQIRGTPGNPEVYAAVVTGLNSVNKSEQLQFEVYPNPFNNRLNITYMLPTDSHVTLTISDVSGREISRLVDMNQIQGFYTQLFDASGLLPGIYFCTLKTGLSAKTLKIIHMKQ